MDRNTKIVLGIAGATGLAVYLATRPKEELECYSDWDCPEGYVCQNGVCVLIGVLFDPWQYDTDESCYIEIEEQLEAVKDYMAGIITIDQLNQVTSLYTNGTRNPAC